jgi:fatty-acyl-CoA synthase
MSQFGQRVGVICGDQRFTYAQFGARCQRLASSLPSLGVAPGDRVALLSFNTHRLLESYYGVVQAHAIVMPLNVRLSPQEFIGILNHSGAKVLCFENDFLPLVEHLRAQCPAIEHWVGLDGKNALASVAYEDLIEGGSPEEADIFAYDENAPAELFYTSGSTGTPKGVVLTHRNLFVHALMAMSLLDPTQEIVDLYTIPLFHANGWGRPQLSTMLGSKQVMVRRFEPRLVFRLIEEHGATDMGLVPTMANMLLQAPERTEYQLGSLRRILLGGAAASPELVARLESAFGCMAFAGYGLTETSPLVTTGILKPGLLIPDEETGRTYRSRAGWPAPGCRVRVVDIYGKDVPRDGKTIGEIVAQGDQIMDGYFREPDATAAVIHDHWFHTGDMAVWDETGGLQIVDRKKEIIISGGENISSIEVERAIMRHEGVLECAVVAAPDDQWGEVPAAIVVPKPDFDLSEAALLEFLQNYLGKFKLPRKIEFTTEQLPKTGTGKIRKNILKERFWAGREKRVQG